MLKQAVIKVCTAQKKTPPKGADVVCGCGNGSIRTFDIGLEEGRTGEWWISMVFVATSLAN